MSAVPAPYSLVIATLDRPDDLALTLAGIATQTHLPAEVIVVDSSANEKTRRTCELWVTRLPLRWIFSEAKSAAQQRNLGADLTRSESEVLGFLDDDITMYPETCADVCSVFADDPAHEIGGIAVRIDEIQRPPPSRLTRFYYWLQAGYRHTTYGGRLFGPAINCLPCYSEPTEGSGDLIRAEWLNSGCVFYRREPFLREKFPAFEGYSFMEDVHCSARIAKTHRLYFHTRARCSHRDGTNALKRDFAGLARQRIRHQRVVAREVMGQHGLGFAWKFLLHRLFASFNIVRRREPGWVQSLRGTWS
jgi:glycosyltransferase involved in cell wall biosynthesis